MFRFFRHRLGHYLLLLLTTSLLTLPNLGRVSLFDFDEGVNAEASREMLEANNWIVPMFNYELRTAKPIMIYWLQMASYQVFGVNEFAARFPSVLAALLTVLLTYELGRSMFRPSTGLLGGLVLSSAIYFCLSAHAAIPDATLLLFTMLTMYLFWIGSVNEGRWWFIPAGMAAGLAVLTKGPVGFALPGLVIFLFFLWNRELYRLWDRRVIWGFLAFCAVALPWYILVTLETRGAWASAFFGKENLQRFSSPMENHRGSIFYHLIGLLFFFAPWSIFLGVSIWNGWKGTASSEGIETADLPSEERKERQAHRFLLCWFGGYLVFFSVAATKLPNYVLPLYPALALLTGRFLDRWRLQPWSFPRWIMPVAWSGLALVGIGAIFGLLIGGGAITLPGVKMRTYPGMEQWAIFGAIPLLGVLCGICFQLKKNRDAVVATLVVTAVLFMGCLAAFVAPTFDDYKAPKELVKISGARQRDSEVKLGSLLYFQPSLVYYGQREVKKFEGFEQAMDFLRLPYEVFLYVPEPVGKELAPRATIPLRLAAKRFDFLKNCDILVLTNR